MTDSHPVDPEQVDSAASSAGDVERADEVSTPTGAGAPPHSGADRAEGAARVGSEQSERLAHLGRPFVQIGGFLSKEIGAIVRQPRLLLVLVAGPFLILLLFAVGYDTQQAVLRTIFVGPPDSVYEESLDQYADELSFYVTNEGYTSDLVAAEELLANGEIDLVVVFPTDPTSALLEGEQATISVLHDKLDPIQQTAVEIAAQVAVQELNATVLAELVGTAQESVVSYEDGVATSTLIVDELDRAVADGDDDEIARLTQELTASTTAMQTALDATEGLSRRLQGAVPPGQAERIDTATDAVRSLADAGERLRVDAEDIDAADIEALRRAVDDVEANLDLVTTIDPDVVSRPFTSDAASLLRDRVNVNDFFAPAAIALLLQHMMLTFAAMSLVQDRATGLFEIYRVGPIGPLRILAGKFLAYLAIGATVATSLVAAVTFGLDVPFRGDPSWVAGGVVGLLAASIAAGLLLSMLARTDSQAVQFAMLTLLLGLFFGGFLLDLDAFEYPVKFLSWMLPVTYGVRLLRDVMLRGVDADSIDIAGLVACTAVYGLGAWLLLRRRLRIR